MAEFFIEGVTIRDRRISEVASRLAEFLKLPKYTAKYSVRSDEVLDDADLVYFYHPNNITRPFQEGAWKPQEGSPDLLLARKTDQFSLRVSSEEISPFFEGPLRVEMESLDIKPDSFRHRLVSVPMHLSSLIDRFIPEEASGTLPDRTYYPPGM